MKKVLVGLALCVLLTMLCVTAFAVETMCILPEDFEGSQGTFTISTEGSNIGGFRGVALRGRTDRANANALPAQLGFEVKEEGEFTVYVHTRDFDSDKGQRNFRVGIDKTTFQQKLGAHGVNGWMWETAGSLKLEKGKYLLKVIDTTAYYPRCDMIIISSDKNIKLPETHAEMKTFSESHKFVKIDIEIPATLYPNQVFRNGFFYTAATVESIVETGTWKFEKMKWVDNDTPLKYLFLNGLNDKDKVTENAKITFAVPKDSKYYVWVRTKDFIDNQGTRVFKTAVDGKIIETEFGCHGIDGWAWERAEIGELQKGYHVLEFVDTSRNYARFDMFLITDDAEFVPDGRQNLSYKLLVKAKFNPVSVVPDVLCPVKPEAVSENAVSYPMRPTTENAVSLNGTYIDCKSDFSGKYPMISAESIFLAMGGKVVYKAADYICVNFNDKAYLFNAGDVFCISGKKKIEMRAAAENIDGEIYIPVNFLNKIEHVSASVNGKDVEVSYIIWR